MFGRVMNLQLIFDTPCFFGIVSLVEGCYLVSVEVVHDKDYLFSLRIAIHQKFNLLGPVRCRTLLSHADMVLATKRLDKPEDAASAIAFVLRIDLFVASWFHRKGSTGIAQQLIWFFVHANDRELSIARPFINIQHVFHASYEFGVFFRWDAPVVVLVGADFVFFKSLLPLTCRLVSLAPP